MEKDVFWKPIPGFEGYYEASNDGNIRSVDHEVPFLSRGYIKTKRLIKGKILTKHIRGKYYFVALHKDGVRHPENVHRLIALTFIPNPENKPCVDHRNGKCLDNRVENLRWATFSENSLNPVTLKRCIENRDAKGGKRASQKVYAYDLKGNFIKDYPSIAECSRQLKLSQRHAWACLNGKQKSTKIYVLKKAPV